MSDVWKTIQSLLGLSGPWLWARYAKDTTSCRTFANNWLHISTHVRFYCWRDCCRTGCFSAWTPWGWWGRWAARRGAPSRQPASPSWPACWCSSTCSLAQVWGLFVRAVASSGLDSSVWRSVVKWKMLAGSYRRTIHGRQRHLPFARPVKQSKPSSVASRQIQTSIAASQMMSIPIQSCT